MRLRIPMISKIREYLRDQKDMLTYIKKQEDLLNKIGEDLADKLQTLEQDKLYILAVPVGHKPSDYSDFFEAYVRKNIPWTPPSIIFIREGFKIKEQDPEFLRAILAKYDSKKS